MIHHLFIFSAFAILSFLAAFPLIATQQPVDELMQAAIEEAQKGMVSGGIPIGSVLVYEGKIIGRGHNQRMQKSSAIHHGEMNCLENAGRLTPHVYREATIYTTLSPCPMCSGAIRLYKDVSVEIPNIVLDIRYATSNNFMGFPLYPSAMCYVHKELAEILKNAQRELELENLGLKIYDGFRPLSVQQAMWDKIKDPRYVSNPAEYIGSHIRGAAV